MPGNVTLLFCKAGIPASFYLVEEEHCVLCHLAALSFFYSILLLVAQLVIFFSPLCHILTWHIPQPFIVLVDMYWCCFSQEVMSPWTLPPTLPNTLSRAHCLATIKCHCQEDLWNVISPKEGGAVGKMGLVFSTMQLEESTDLHTTKKSWL